ncbi:MAG: hypothetical protein V2I33_22890, partial [Kangiellaceae bacterium]|nr:hypothetical protein [Kangiellaceae bacterium]
MATGGPYWTTDSVYGYSSVSRDNVYFGELNEAGFRHGYGRMTFGNEDLYDGSWEEGKMSGQGVYTWSNGGRY